MQLSNLIQIKYVNLHFMEQQEKDTSCFLVDLVLSEDPRDKSRDIETGPGVVEG